MKKTKEPQGLKSKDDYERDLLHSEAELRLLVAKTGDRIAAAKGYRTLLGMDALVRYFVDKYHWMPSQARSLTLDELHMLTDGIDAELAIGATAKKGGAR